jgi:hypothetical protein
MQTECDEVADNMPVPKDTTYEAALAVFNAAVKPEESAGEQWKDNIIERLQERAGWQLRAFETAIKVCTDDVQRLRPCDVYRAIGVAHDAGPYEQGEDKQLAQTKAFVAWLRGKRPDLEAKIAEAVAWVEEEEKISLAA